MQVRLLAVYGSEDPMAADAGQLLAMFRHSEKEVLPGASHACYVDDPARFNDRLVQFAAKAFTQKVEQDEGFKL